MSDGDIRQSRKNKKYNLTTRCDKSLIKSYTVDDFLSPRIPLHSNIFRALVYIPGWVVANTVPG